MAIKQQSSQTALKSSLIDHQISWHRLKHGLPTSITTQSNFFIGITPQGCVSFISKAWGGRTSDKYITEHCGFLDNIRPGDVILADRGFDIADSVGVMQATVLVPAFMAGKRQLSSVDVFKTRNIANVRIHVERVLGLVRQKYKILGGPIPVQYCMKVDENEYTTIDKVAVVCCALANITPSVINLE